MSLSQKTKGGLVSIVLWLVDGTCMGASSELRGAGSHSEWMNMPQFKTWLYLTQHSKFYISIT